MTIAFVQGAGNNVTVSSTTSLTISASGAGNQGIVMVRISQQTTNPSISDNGAGGGGTWNQFSHSPITDTNNNDQLFWWLCTNLVTGTTQITINFTGSNIPVRWAYHEYSVGVGSILVEDQYATNNTSAPSGAGNPITGTNTGTTSNANELILAFFKNEDNTQPAGSVIANNSFTLRESEGKLFTEDQVVSSIGTYGGSWVTGTGWLGEGTSNPAITIVTQTLFEQSPTPAGVTVIERMLAAGGQILSIGNQVEMITP